MSTNQFVISHYLILLVASYIYCGVNLAEGVLVLNGATG